MNSSKSFFIVIGGFALLLIISWVAIGTLVSGFVVGTEFSPDTLDARDFAYYELPIIHMQVTPIQRTVRTPAVSTSLLSSKLVTQTSSGDGPRWDLSHVVGGGALRRRGDAELLLTYLESKTFDWETWTTNHPELAKEFWPLIFQVARRGDYILIPDLFRIVRDCETVDQFQNRSSEYLARQYQEWGAAEHAAQRSTKAIERIDVALQFAERQQNLKQELQKLRQEWGGE